MLQSRVVGFGKLDPKGQTVRWSRLAMCYAPFLFRFSLVNDMETGFGALCCLQRFSPTAAQPCRG